MDDILASGPSRGIATAILAVGCAVILIGWRAIPLYREWVKAIQESRTFRAETDAKVAELTGQAERLSDHIRILTVENKQLRADVDRLWKLVTKDDGPRSGPA
jgi:cytochrome c oxidase assembly protein Cox11